MKKIPVYDRPREKLIQRGASCLSDQELISVLLGNGIKGKDVCAVAEEIALKMRNDFDTINRMDELQTIQGVGPVKAAQLTAVFELARRYLVKDKHAISSPHDLMPFVAELCSKKQEHFLTVTIDGGSRLIKKRVVFIGTLNQSLIHPREVFVDAITDRAKGVFLVHNHPSGNCKPSVEDVCVTRRLVEAGEIIGIEVMDHIILGKTEYFSFMENAII
ncbi:MAG: DNA repair protein RadC [Spirochaetales bacterium]|nr:DNA repair protein RadC [Spirochaetales bacterium]